MKIYVAQDKDGAVFAYLTKPVRRSDHWNVDDGYITMLNITDKISYLPKDVVPKWEDPEPREIDIAILAPRRTKFQIRYKVVPFLAIIIWVLSLMILVVAFIEMLLK